MKIMREIVRNTEMGIQSIDNLCPYIEDEGLNKLVLDQQKKLREFHDEANLSLSCEEREQAKSNVIQKTMLKAGVNVNAMLHNDASHIAEMLTEGYRMGVDSVQKCVNELKKDGTEMPPLASDILKFYDKSVKALREYL